MEDFLIMLALIWVNAAAILFLLHMAVKHRTLYLSANAQLQSVTRWYQWEQDQTAKLEEKVHQLQGTLQHERNRVKAGPPAKPQAPSGHTRATVGGRRHHHREAS